MERFHFPSLDRHRVGTGRLQVERHFDTALVPLPGAYEPFFDTRTGRACFLVADHEDPGATACLDPDEVQGAMAAYADPSCQDRIAVQMPWDSLGCREEPRPVVHTLVGQRFGGLCETLPEELREAGPEHRGQVYTRRFDGACEPFDLRPSQGRRPYAHRLGPVRGLEGYPRVRRLIE